MTTTKDNWLSNEKQINTTQSDTTATATEYVEVTETTTTTNDTPPNAQTGIATLEVTASHLNEAGELYHPVVILNPSESDIPEVLPTLSLKEIRQILIDKDYAQLHGHLENESLVVLPKAQLEKLMSTMRDNMVMMRGLDMLANLVKPLVEDSKEGKALTKFMVDNADMFSGKDFGMAETMRLMTGLPSVIKNGKALIGQIDVNLLKENAGFLDEFKGVLRRSNSPFIQVLGAFGDGMDNVKKLNA